MYFGKVTGQAETQLQNFIIIDNVENFSPFMWWRQGEESKLVRSHESAGADPELFV